MPLSKLVNVFPSLIFSAGPVPNLHLLVFFFFQTNHSYDGEKARSRSLALSSTRSLLVLYPSIPSASGGVAMLCWGSSARGQLGLGVAEAAVFEPRRCHVFDGRGLKEVACGSLHSLFLMHDGSVYTCGSCSDGQLGHEKSGVKPGKKVDPGTFTDNYIIYL